MPVEFYVLSCWKQVYAMINGLTLLVQVPESPYSWVVLALLSHHHVRNVVDRSAYNPPVSGHAFAGGLNVNSLQFFSKWSWATSYLAFVLTLNGYEVLACIESICGATRVYLKSLMA